MAAPALPLLIVHNRPFIELRYSRQDQSVLAWTWLDTGGGAVILAEPLVRALRLERAGESFMEEGSQLTPVASPAVYAGDLALPLHGVPTLMIDRPSVGPAAFQAPAFLPARLFRQFTVTFDYPGREVHLDTPGAAADAGAVVEAPVHPQSAFVRVELEIAGERLGFLLDTGASYSMISSAVLERWQAAQPDWPVTRGAYGCAQMLGGGDEAFLSMVRVPEARLGDVRLRNAGFVTRPAGVFERYMSAQMTAPVVGALAGNVLRHLRFTMDYGRQRLHVQPRVVEGRQDPQSAGLCLRSGGAGWVVARVADSAHPTTRAQVSPGDEVMAVGDQCLEGSDLGEAVNALSGAPGEVLAVTLRREGTPRRVDVPVVAVLP